MTLRSQLKNNYDECALKQSHDCRFGENLIKFLFIDTTRCSFADSAKDILKISLIIESFFSLPRTTKHADFHRTPNHETFDISIPFRCTN